MPDEKPAAAQTAESFLERWSRLKKEAATASLPTVEANPAVDTEMPALPPIESLTPESDFSVFMQPRVPSELRQAALKKLFADPHFNVMDGLDIYIDDYTKPDPIPATVVAQLAQFRNLWGVQPEGPSREEHETTVAAQAAEAECANATESASACPADGSEQDLQRLPDGDPGLDTMSTDTSSAGSSVPVQKGG